MVAMLLFQGQVWGGGRAREQRSWCVQGSLASQGSGRLAWKATAEALDSGLQEPWEARPQSLFLTT